MLDKCLSIWGTAPQATGTQWGAGLLVISTAMLKNVQACKDLRAMWVLEINGISSIRCPESMGGG